MKLPRFTLRDLFWLVLVVGMGLGWWMERNHLKRAYSEIATEYTGCYIEAEHLRGWAKELAGEPPYRPIGQRLAAEATQHHEASIPFPD